MQHHSRIRDLALALALALSSSFSLSLSLVLSVSLSLLLPSLHISLHHFAYTALPPQKSGTHPHVDHSLFKMLNIHAGAQHTETNVFSRRKEERRFISTQAKAFNQRPTVGKGSGSRRFKICKADLPQKAKKNGCFVPITSPFENMDFGGTKQNVFRSP
jgi:hypothetical protein